jgi:cytochrome P450
MHPEHALAAASHADPYPYYGRLVTTMPVYRDDRLGMWVAAGAGAVQAALTHSELRVRPLHEPVPAPLIGSKAGEIFRRLVRMNDGAFHQRVKPALKTAVPVHFDVSHWAEVLERRLAPIEDAAALEAFACQLPVYTLASALGIAPDDLPELTTHVAAFVRCLSPGATAADIERADRAAVELLRGFEAAPLIDGVARDVATANALGLLLQAYEATAGLILNTVVALGRYPVARAAPLNAFIQEVARFDAPVQNTRRYAASAITLAGHEVAPAEVVLVVLAAANRDRSVNSHPERFDPARRAARCFTFGVGTHGCVGERVAVSIAAAAISRLLAVGFDPRQYASPVAYRPSHNMRIPQWSRA